VFEKGDTLPEPHYNNDRRFRIDLLHDGNIYSLFSHQLKSAPSILKWIYETVGKSYSCKIESRNPSVSKRISKNIDNEIPNLISYNDSMAATPSKSLINGVAVGSIFVAAFAFVGVIVGNVVYDENNNCIETNDECLLLDDNGDVVDFNKINNDEKWS
jgi:hypothetical protein